MLLFLELNEESNYVMQILKVMSASTVRDVSRIIGDMNTCQAN